MFTIARVLVGLSFVWAVIALTVQVVLARGGGRRDFSRATGDPRRGMLYNFTVAMLPWHKETARWHAAEFVLGIVLHVGTLLSLIAVLLLAAWPTIGARLIVLLRPLAAAALVAGIALAIRRCGSKAMRAISVPDDHLAIGATCGLLALTAASSLGAVGTASLLLYAALLLVYLPLGKLRHAVFFFIARADFGARLGYRGVYPPAEGEAR